MCVYYGCDAGLGLNKRKMVAAIARGPEGM